MLSDDVLRRALTDFEADHVERTRATRDLAKFGEAICAFSNDLLDRRTTGVLFVGVNDDGSCANVEIGESLIQSILAFRRDGTILPPPSLTVRRHMLDGCTMAIVEVEPSSSPPVRFNGRVCVRAGPRRDFATPDEERRLVERRRWANLPFDQQPVTGATIADLDLLRFQEEYLPSAIHPDVLAENGRSPVEQLRGSGFVDRTSTPTVVGLLVVGKAPRDFLPGAYVQFVRYQGVDIGDIVLDHREIGGPLSPMLKQIDEVIAANNRRRADISGTRQVDQPDYPPAALQELIRNAVIHRSYEATNAPVIVSWFDDRVEITSPGGPYGAVTIEHFAEAGLSDARNPALASAAKALGYVQRFGSGIPRAQEALRRNGSPLADFRAERNYIGVTVKAAR